MNFNSPLTCGTCRLKWWQCGDRIRYNILVFFGETLIQCHKKEHIEKETRIREMLRMYRYVCDKKIELEGKLRKDGAL